MTDSICMYAYIDISIFLSACLFIRPNMQYVCMYLCMNACIRTQMHIFNKYIHPVKYYWKIKICHKDDKEKKLYHEA